MRRWMKGRVILRDRSRRFRAALLSAGMAGVFACPANAATALIVEYCYQVNATACLKPVFPDDDGGTHYTVDYDALRKDKEGHPFIGVRTSIESTDVRTVYHVFTREGRRREGDEGVIEPTRALRSNWECVAIGLLGAISRAEAAWDLIKSTCFPIATGDCGETQCNRWTSTFKVLRAGSYSFEVVGENRKKIKGGERRTLRVVAAVD